MKILDRIKEILNIHKHRSNKDLGSGRSRSCKGKKPISMKDIKVNLPRCDLDTCRCNVYGQCYEPRKYEKCNYKRLEFIFQLIEVCYGDIDGIRSILNMR